MAAELERVYEYRVLMGRRQTGADRLSSLEDMRLTTLGRAIPLHLPTVDDPDPRTHLTRSLPAHFLFGGASVTGVVRVITGAGLCIVTAEPPNLGSRILVHVADAAHGIEYGFPGRVVARVVRGTTSATISFAGAPSQMRMGNRVSGVWRPQATPSAHPDAFDGPTSQWPGRKVDER